MPPMVRGVVEANEIELLRPVLRLALDEQRRLELAELRPGPGVAAYLPAQRHPDLGQDRRRRARRARHPTERSARASRPSTASCPRRRCDGPYRYRGTFGKAGAERELQARHGTARRRRLGALQGDPAVRRRRGSTYTLDGAPRRPDGQAAHRRRADRAAADRRTVAGASPQPPATPKRWQPRRRDQAGQSEAAFDLQGRRLRQSRRRNPIEPRAVRSSRTGGRSSSPASCRRCGARRSRSR